ncbi:MAG: hypothetical protein IJ202_12925 [Bacteroidales bacterium]|nr:hypothetical protein [Bacteroidales bacterium]
MKKIHHIALLLALLAVTLIPSCKKKEVTHFRVPIVEKLLSDTTAALFHPISSYNPKNTAGSITIFGAPDEVVRMTEYLLTADLFNNVDGSRKGDGLPDFAGEVIAPILDLANSPYQGYIEAENENLLSDIAVRAFLTALDTAAYASPTDTVPTLGSKKAKIVVFASSLFGTYGLPEIDTLNAVVGRKVPVMSGPGAMVDYIYTTRGKDQKIAVLTSSTSLGAGVYSTVFSYAAKKHGVVPDYTVFCPDTARSEAGKLREFLWKCEASLSGNKLSAMIVDDPTVDMDRMDEALATIMSSDSPSDARLRAILSPGFEMIDPKKAVSTMCYRILRERNIFTHKIAYPDIEEYVTRPSYVVPTASLDSQGNLIHGYKYGRIPSDGPSAYSVVPLRDEYLSRAFLEYMEADTPNFFSLYVR